MVGTGAVVAERLRRIAAEEDRARVPDLRQQRLRILDRQLQVLGCDAVHELAGLIEVARLDQRPAPGERGLDHVAPRHRREEALDAGCDALDERRIRRDQDRLRQFVVLGLGEQVHRHPVGLRLAVAHHHHLRGPRYHVDADHAEHAPLGGSDIGIARTHDLVHRRDGRRAISERCDRLRAADGEHAVHAANRGGGEHQFVALSARGRHHHYDLAHAGDLRRHRVHDHGGWIGGLAAGYVDADPVQRGHALSEFGAIGIGEAPRSRKLFLVIEAHAPGGGGERFAPHARDAAQRPFELGARDFELCRGRRLDPVKAPRILEHRGIPPRFHVSEYGRDGGFHLRVLHRLEGEQLRQPGIEVRPARVQASNLHRPAARASASSNG